MKMMMNDISNVDTDICIKVYNPENKELIAVYPTMKMAAYRLGISSTTLITKCDRRIRVFSPTLNLTVACRYATTKETDKELIEKTLKYNPL